MRDALRENWRLLMLVVLVTGAALALFGPLGADAGDAQANNTDATVDDFTNLKYGLELSGGTRIRGELVGMTAEEVPLSQGDGREVESTVAEELGLRPLDVEVRQRTAEEADVEVYSGNVTEDEFVSALDAAGVDASTSDIRSGVTQETRETAVQTLSQRIDQTGLSGSTVTTVSTAGGDNFVVVEVPGADRRTVRDLIGDPGRVQVIAGYPVETANGTELRTQSLLTQGDFSGISPAERSERTGSPQVPVQLTDESATRYANFLQETGFTSEGVGQCTFDPAQHDEPREGEYCLYTVVDGDYVYGASMGQGLADDINSGNFETNPGFVMETGSMEEAQDLELNLRAGALPTELDIQSEQFISPSQGQLFKPLSLLTGLAAWIMVSIVVYFWYRDVKVAVPMLVTAASEVFLLLGFAAGIGMALNLSHIAGFIAVIGTGLDDLIIMADEILQQDTDVKTGRVFQSRFRKAFWVIGMAAATTIIAMSPLAILSLGELQGFALITILGVLIGVGVTRPAYGDVLRRLVLERDSS